MIGSSSNDDKEVKILRWLFRRCFSHKVASPSIGGILTITGTLSNTGVLLKADFQS